MEREGEEIRKMKVKVNINEIDEYEQTERKNTRLVNRKAIETRTDIQRHE